jgi:hypothetical protein
MSKAPKIAREVAEADFERMCGPYRVELDVTDLPEDEAKEFAELKEKIVRLIMRGQVVVGDDGNPTYTAPGAAKGFTFHPPTGATFMALETYPSTKPIANTICAMADMTHVDKSEFSRLALPDFHACSNLAKLFLADR